MMNMAQYTICNMMKDKIGHNIVCSWCLRFKIIFFVPRFKSDQVFRLTNGITQSIPRYCSVVTKGFFFTISICFWHDYI